jgi:hypothetical protein
MRIWPLLAAALALFGYMGYRVLSLEQRVEQLSRRLGEAPSGGAAGAPSQGSGYEQRIATLERDQRMLVDDLRTLEQATADPIAPRHIPSALDPGAGEQRILSLIGRQQTRVLDRQLEFHRTRWLEQRETALEEFATRFKLSPRQTDQLSELLVDEIDRLVEVMRRPDAAENPERVADEWRATLATTDSSAHRVLDPSQIPAWDTVRLLERRILWPWLPER